MKRVLVMVAFAACATTKQAAPVTAAKVEAACPEKFPDTPGALESVIGKRIDKVCFIGDVKLRDVVSPGEGQPLDAAMVSDALVELLATGLVRDADAVAIPLDAERIVLAYFVSPFPKISNVRVEGAKAFPSDSVLDGLNPGDFAYASGVTLQKLRDAVTDFYLEHGYPGVKVNVALQSGDAVVSVEEGELASVDRIRFSGAKKVKEKELRETLVSKEGAVFNEEAAERDVLAINAVYFDHGMVRATVEYTRSGKELVFTVNEGDIFKLGTLAFSGYKLSDGDVFLKSLESKKGTVFSRLAIQRDLKRISERASKEGSRVNVTPLTDIDSSKKIINVTFDLERLPGPISF